MGCAVVKPQKQSLVCFKNGVWADRLKEAREARGIELDDAAAQLGVHPKLLAAIEAGRVWSPRIAAQRFVVLYQFPLAFFLDEPESGFGEMHFSGDGIVACGFQGCPYIAERLCDYPMGGGKTCDQPLCEDHAQRQADEIDFCPTHALMAGWS